MEKWGGTQGCIKLARSASRPGSQQPPALPDSLVLWALLAFLRAASRDGSRSAWELDAALGGTSEEAWDHPTSNIEHPTSNGGQSVREYVHSTYRKLHVNSRIEAVVKYVNQ